MVTISTHNGSTVHQAHNIRSEKTVSKEKHINPNGIHETWHHEDERAAYHRLFDKSLEDYNNKQKRSDRKVKSYYNAIKNDAKKHTSYEMIIGIYGKDENGIHQCSDELGKEIMKDFVKGWKKRNPNLEMIGAYYHADEEGEPHVHIDYIPVARGYTRGLETQTGLVRAFEEMGFQKQGKATAQIQWQQRENEVLTSLCQEKGLVVHHPRKEHSKHLDTNTFKAEKALLSASTHVKELLDVQDDLRAETANLKAIRDKAELQAQKAIERKVKAFSKSFKYDKSDKRRMGYSYNIKLYEEVVSLFRERKKDVKTILNNDLDVKRKLDQAEQAKMQADKLLSDAREKFDKAEKYRQKQKKYIIGTAQTRAKEMFDEFIQKEFSGQVKERDERLREHCSNITFSDGSSVLDSFEQAEKELRAKAKDFLKGKEKEEEYER